MWILWTILGLLGAFIAVTLVRAAFWTPEKVEFEPLPDEQVDVEKYRKDLTGCSLLNCHNEKSNEIIIKNR